MDYITVSAKTLDDAITEALIQLGVTSDRLDYIVIEKGSAGFLGIGMKQAVIKARRKEEEKPEPEEEVNEPEIAEIEKESVKEVPKKESKKEFKREFKRENKKEFKKGKDYIIMIRNECLNADFKKLDESLEALVKGIK